MTDGQRTKLVHVVPKKAAPVGLPRPMLRFGRMPSNNPHEPKSPDTKLPSPWIAHEPSAKGQWTMWDADSLRKSHKADGMLCQVCGEQLDRVKFLAILGMKGTSGPAMHLKCGVIACTYCPHLKEEEANGRSVGFIYEGDGNGLADEWDDEMLFDVDESSRPVNLTELKEELKKQKALAKNAAAV